MGSLIVHVAQFLAGLADMPLDGPFEATQVTVKLYLEKDKIVPEVC